MPIRMVRKQAWVWAASEPPGTYTLDEGMTLGGRPCQRLQFICPNHRSCAVMVAAESFKVPLSPTPSGKERNLTVWAGPGDPAAPTLTPSVNCRTHDEDGNPTSGCGWHGFITGGEML